MKHMYNDVLRSRDNLQTALRLTMAGLAEFPLGTAVAVRGLSGAVVGALLQAAGRRVFYVRKGADPSHTHCAVVEPEKGSGEFKYVIVDDFSVSGATVKAIVRAMCCETRGQHVGCVFYAPQSQSHPAPLVWHVKKA